MASLALLGSAVPERSLLIIAPRALSHAAGDYAQARAPALPVSVVALEDALADPAASGGADDPEKLKKYLYHRWAAARQSPVTLNYVLLVGDADVMPVRYMVLDRVTEPAFDYAFYPSDLYYADLARPDGSFDSWNAATGDPADPGTAFHASYYGEVRGEKNKSDPINYDAIDYRPEIAVGRWPVSTPEEVATIAAKSLAYERWVTEDPAARRAALVAVGGWVENRPAMDEIGALLPRGWSVEKRYWSGAGRDEPLAPDEANVVDLLNSGVALVLHSGHGSDTAWAESLHTGSLARLTNISRPAVMMSAGCSTARLATLPPYEAYVDTSGVEHTGTNAGEVFTSPPPPPAPYQRGPHNPTGLGEQLLRAGGTGAAAYIGCNTGSQPCGMTLMRGFADGLGAYAGMAGLMGATVRLGDCWVYAIGYYYDNEHLAGLAPTESWYPASIFFQGMKFMLLGDPSLPIP